jgi:hypothetical protein
MARPILLTALLLNGLFLALLPPLPAYACSCVAPGSPEESLRLSDAVFSGRVRSVKLSRSGDFEEHRVTFQVQSIWKGSVTASIELLTAPDTGGCGFPFEIGRSYLVYAHAAEGTLRASLCSRSNFLEAATEDLAALGPGTPPPPSDTSVSWPLLALGGVLIAAGAVLTLRRRRGPIT